ncbi:hypothetical protein GGH95_005658, partial [Coemansia sp. RSA 1836]
NDKAHDLPKGLAQSARHDGKQQHDDRALVAGVARVLLGEKRDEGNDPENNSAVRMPIYASPHKQPGFKAMSVVGHKVLPPHRYMDISPHYSADSYMAQPPGIYYDGTPAPEPPTYRDQFYGESP